MTKTESPGPSERRTFLSTSGFEDDDVALLELKPDTIKAPTSASGKDEEDASRIGHVIRLSSIDHCMPRAYIRVCLAFRLPPLVSVDKALTGLGRFLTRTVEAAPFLAGYVHPSSENDSAIGRVELRFTEEDVRTFPAIQTRQYTSEEMPWTYDELSEKGLPPSAIRPDLVSALPENTNDGRAPVFRVQANIIEGGLIVSIYLHHCVSDGSGLGLLVSGGILNGTHVHGHVNGAADSTQINGSGDSTAADIHDLAAIAARESRSRVQLCRSKGYDIERQYSHNLTVPDDAAPKTSSVGRGCVFVIPHHKMNAFKALITKFLPKDDNNVTPYITDHDVLQSLLWHRLTQARRHSLSPTSKVTSSTLLIPVNIRGRMLPPLPSSFFGSAVDFASARQSLAHLSTSTPSAYALTALAIRQAVTAVQDPYVRATIALSNTPNVDVRDLLAANMNRTTGADMYITSWLGLPLYESGDLGMGLGKPDWVRKPWSRDPGACIILPQDPRRAQVEVVVQLVAEDMARLLRDEAFMEFVEKTIE
jgi:trichothecene 3-O-acetyltransferase